MKEVIALLIGFVVGTAVVVLAGNKVLAEIQKAKTELEAAILRALGGSQETAVPKRADKHPIAGGNPTPIGMSAGPSPKL